MGKAQIDMSGSSTEAKRRPKAAAKRSKALLAEVPAAAVADDGIDTVKKSDSKAAGARSEKKRKEKEKAPKQKVVRDSFTMPETEYESIGTLKNTCLSFGVAVKKSELLRAGIGLLNQLSGDELKRVVLQIENIKTGRPAGKQKKHKHD